MSEQPEATSPAVTSTTPDSPPPAAPPPPPPDAPPPAPPTPPPPAAPRFDLGALFGFAFRDPRAVSKFLIGSLAVVLIPLLGLGLVALLGFGLRTVRGSLRGDEHPMPEWDDLGGLLLDGLKALGVVLAYGLSAAIVGMTLVAFSAFWIAVGRSLDSAVFMLTSALGTLVAVIFLLLVVLLAKVLLPTGLLRLAATGQFGSAFRFGENLALVGANLRIYIYLLLTLILFAILADASVLLCVVGAIPGAFWGFTASGAAIGHAGRLMGVADRSATAPTG